MPSIPTLNLPLYIKTYQYIAKEAQIDILVLTIISIKYKKRNKSFKMVIYDILGLNIYF